MVQRRTVSLTRQLILSLASVLLWISLLTGGFSIYIGSTAIGIVWIVAGIALIAALAQGSLMSRIEGRKVPLASVALILVVIMLIAISEIFNLFISKRFDTVAYLFDIAYSLGVILLGGYAALQLARSIGSASDSGSGPDDDAESG